MQRHPCRNEDDVLDEAPREEAGHYQCSGASVLTNVFATNDATLRELGFPQVISALADYTTTNRGRELALARRFYADESIVQLSLTRIEQARAVLDEQKAIPVSGADDVRGLVVRAAKGAVLSGEELVACGRLLRAAMDVRSFLRARRERMSELCELGAVLADFSPIAARIDYMLEPSGAVRDQASEILAMHRRRARGLHAEARRRIEAMLADTDFSAYLQDKYFSVRGERYVLPVNTSFRAQVPGIVHNASQTGLTLFVEPQALVDLGNELAIAESLALEEERRILAELSLSVGDRADDIASAVECLGALDVVQAAARLAEQMRAVSPQLVPATADIELRGVRHPLLVLQNKQVVANDVVVRAPGQALIVSGPNAGGKTVSISATGLCVLMARAGLQIPTAEGSHVPLFVGVVSIIGDAQDLGRDLSTFSAHLTALSDALLKVNAGWLVVVDEIAADTDPTQGAALARAILEEFVDLGVRVLVTTHLDEVKALGLTDPRFVNARVGTNEQTFLPTYRLELGAAGGSGALEVAARVGLPGVVVERARAYLKTEGLLTTALARLQKCEQETETARRGLAAEEERLSGERHEAQRLREELAQARLDIERHVRVEIEAELKVQRESISRLISELQSQPQMRVAQQAQREVDELLSSTARDLARLQVTAQSSQERALSDKPITAGSWVMVVPLGQEGRVIAVTGKSATVEVGSLRTRARLVDLVALIDPGKAGQQQRQRTANEVIAAPLEIADGRCDVRGMRADEAMSVLERFLDDRYLSGPNIVTVIHGHGSGVLKQLVREALQKSPYVESFRPGDRHEGGDGTTVIQLRT